MRYAVIAAFMSLSACGPSSNSPDVTTPSVPTPTYFIPPEATQINGHNVFIKRPAVESPGKPWAWYAPTFLSTTENGTPSAAEEGYYFDQLNAAGITVVGMDIGESYGSPLGRELFEEFYQSLQAQGYALQGCMILQSRGGLMGYNWMLDHPGRVKCVAGIYPLTTVTDYVGVVNAAASWGYPTAWLAANLATESPLERNNPFVGINILHVHGDADTTVRLNFDQQFISQTSNGSLIVVPGMNHSPTSPMAFHNDDLLNFLLTNLQ